MGGRKESEREKEEVEEGVSSQQRTSGVVRRETEKDVDVRRETLSSGSFDHLCFIDLCLAHKSEFAVLLLSKFLCPANV